MSSINTDEFFLDAARILVRLHASFPQPVILQVDDICGTEETDEFGMHSARYLACFSTMLWLAEEGYLRYAETIRSEAIDQAVLSARSFVLLVTPGPAQPNEDTDELPQSVAAQRSSLGYQLQAALRPRDSTRVNELILQLMQQMLSA